MKRGPIISVMLFTAFFCTVFVFLNPVLCHNLENETFSEGEVFTPSNDVYDFGDFKLNSSKTQNFTVKHVVTGHVLLVDETGGKVINVIHPDRMIHYKKSFTKSFINGELSKTGWMVDGVEVHEIEFWRGDTMYSACVKDTSSGTLIYIATPTDNETAEMISSLRFS